MFEAIWNEETGCCLCFSVDNDSFALTSQDMTYLLNVEDIIIIQILFEDSGIVDTTKLHKTKHDKQTSLDVVPTVLVVLQSCIAFNQIELLWNK